MSKVIELLNILKVALEKATIHEWLINEIIESKPPIVDPQESPANRSR